MQIKNLLFAILMLTAPSSSYAQTLSVINGDTLVSITVNDARKLNEMFVDRQECVEERMRSWKMLDTCSRIVTLQQQRIDDKDQQLALKQDIIIQYKGVVGNLDKQLATLNKTNRVNKWERNILFIGAAILGIKLLL